MKEARQRKAAIPPNVKLARLRARMTYTAVLIETAARALLDGCSVETVAGELKRQAKAMRETAVD